MKSKRLIILLVIVLIFPYSLLAASTTSYKLGQFEMGTIQLVYDDVSINTYKAYGTHYVAVTDLIQLGLNIDYNHATKTTSISLPETSLVTPTSAALSITNKSFTNYTGTVQIGHFRTQSLSCENHVFIPLAALRQLGTLSFTENTCIFSPTPEVPVVATETSLKSFYDEPLQVTLLDIYWQDEAILNTSTYMLNPNEVLPRTPSVIEQDAIYIATIIQSATGEQLHYVNNSYLGQLNEPLLKKYARIKNGTFLDDYGDPIALDKIIWVEDTINSKNLSSPTQYLVWTRIDEQSTYIFEGSENNWTLIKHFICSTGRDHTPTPKGKFALTRKVPSFGQDKGYCCKHAFGFIGTTYLYHSIIFDKTGSYLLENKGVLGKKASEGCIRFSVENAKWFYDHMIPGTTVYIS